MHMGRQTNTHTHHNTSHPFRGQSNQLLNNIRQGLIAPAIITCVESMTGTRKASLDNQGCMWRQQCHRVGLAHRYGVTIADAHHLHLLLRTKLHCLVNENMCLCVCMCVCACVCLTSQYHYVYVTMIWPRDKPQLHKYATPTNLNHYITNHITLSHCLLNISSPPTAVSEQRQLNGGHEERLSELLCAVLWVVVHNKHTSRLWPE